MTAQKGRPAEEPEDQEGGPAEGDDPFAPELNLIPGVAASFAESAKPVREGKPGPDEFFQIHPDPDYVKDYYLMVLNEGGEKERFVIAPSLRYLVPDNVHPHRLFVGVNLHGSEFVWAVRLYDDEEDRKGFGGRSWSVSALEHIETAKMTWIKLRGDRSCGEYIAKPAGGVLHAPKWSGRSHRELVERAYKENVIDTPDHSAIRRVNGEA